MTSDPAAGLARFLRTEFGQPVQVSNISGLSTGARRTNVAFDAETSTHTLRLVATFVPNAIELAPVTVEAAVRELARAHGVPVPPVVAVCTDAGYTDAPFLVSERIDGETVPRKVLRLVHAEAIGDRVAEQVGAAMATPHTIDPQLAPPELPGAPTGNPAEQLLTELITGVRTLRGDRPVFTLALRWLVNRLPSTPEHRSLLHTDLRNELHTQCEMLRALIHKTAWSMDRYGTFAVSEQVSMCNYWANRLCCEAADRAMQIHGGLGYSRHTPFEHIYRHHRRYRITEGTEEIQMRRIAGYLFGFMRQREPKGVRPE